MTSFEQEQQHYIDKFYKENGDCCAGCDHWRWHNTAVGECIKNAPVSSQDRIAMLGLESLSLPVGAGHIFTPREHWCCDFFDSDKCA